MCAIGECRAISNSIPLLFQVKIIRKFSELFQFCLTYFVKKFHIYQRSGILQFHSRLNYPKPPYKSNRRLWNTFHLPFIILSSCQHHFREFSGNIGNLFSNERSQYRTKNLMCNFPCGPANDNLYWFDSRWHTFSNHKRQLE